MKPSLPLQVCNPHTLYAIFNRLYYLLHFIALVLLFYYRLFSFPSSEAKLPYLLVFASELLLSLIWICNQAYLWRPVSRTTFPERLPEDTELLPAIDVFICTADPKREPPFEVMNTVLSAMALDYPPEKLAVYLSDDGGSSLTLNGMKEAYRFASSWLPFCTRFGIKTRCPKVFFSSLKDDDPGDPSYHEEKEKIKSNYELFKERLERAEEKGETRNTGGNDRSPLIEVIYGESEGEKDTKDMKMPLLVYVSREKRHSYPHNFKAGALNVLLRVSGIITNSPYILVLDCDMFCNDPTSARQAMCCHLDPKISPSLAFVQFPQKFHNISESDIYDAQLRTIFVVKWPGMDGLEGPILSGTGFYVKREALYGDLSQKEVLQLKQSYGHSYEFIFSVRHRNQHHIIESRDLPSKLKEEAQFLATCTYEKHTLWGEEIGFLYHSVVEDYFTGFILHCKGWTSVLCNPARPAFLGSATTNLNDTIVQGIRWNCGLFEVNLSKFFPLIYGLSRMSLLQTLCYAYLAFQPLYSLPLWCLATLPQLCLLNGISIYPKVLHPWSVIFSSILVASLLKHLEEVLSSGGSVQTWLNEQRIWMVKSVTAYTFGTIDAVLKCIGMREASFLPTNKVVDDEQETLYKQGKFNFQTTTILLAPIVTLFTLNVVSFMGGVAMMILTGRWNEMLPQVVLSLYILLVNFPIFEGMFLRKDNGRIPVSVSFLSLVLSLLFLHLGRIILLR